MKVNVRELRALFIQFFKFGLIGVIGFLVDYGMLHFGLDVLGLGRYGSAIFSFPFAVTATWIGNRVFTFKGLSSQPAHHEWARFLAVCAGGFVLNRGAYALLIANVPLAYAYPVLGLVAGTAAGMFFNFFVARRFVFR
ncbi:MAG: GtrA family protein [Pseudomonadota bacterium]|nr:GtrA family protein [Pseudomonadota bacterium]